MIWNVQPHHASGYPILVAMIKIVLSLAAKIRIVAPLAAMIKIVPPLSRHDQDLTHLFLELPGLSALASSVL
jgi:hypothetical protein